MRPTRALSRAVGLLLAAVVVLTGFVLGAGAAAAADGDVGYQGPSFSGTSGAPTSDKPQSKLWHVQGIWFATMFDTGSQDWHIFRLDRGTQTWVDTGVPVDDRANTLSDALWDGSHLYIASNVVTVSTLSNAVPSKPDSPARLYRYSYDSAAQTFAPDAGFPTVITTWSSESLTIDKDSTGTLWATWTQVSGSSSAGFTNAVHVNSATGEGSTWGAPFVLPVAGAAPSPDDISSIVAFGGNRIGVLWSNQLDETVYWAVHVDGQPVSSWRGSPGIRGNSAADDHLNIKSLVSDQAGRVYAVVKTAADEAPGSPGSAGQILLLVFKPGTGSWSVTTFGTIDDCHTRPQILLDEEHQLVYVLATAPLSGCPFSGAAGSIVMKAAPMAAPVFPAGRGVPIITDAGSPNVNDVTTTKQALTSTTGLVALASNTVTKRYWHAFVPLDGQVPAAPTAAFTASAETGPAPLEVQFTDTSTGGPSSWAWDFGNGQTSAEQNPTHVFALPGTYPVTLRATNSVGESAPATRTVTVTVAPTTGPTVSAGPSATAVAADPAAAVPVPVPAGVQTGDLLVAQVTADNAPTMSEVPPGWTPVLPQLSVASGARVFVYSHLVGDATAEPAAYPFTLSAAQRWGAVVGSFRGVDPANPFDTAATTKTDATYRATSLAVPGVSTLSDGAMLVGGVGFDSRTVAVTPPAGWAEIGESSTGQVAEMAVQARPTAGATGVATWSFGAAAAGGWLRALRPAGAGPAPVVPTAAFTASAETGPAPLEVQFTDTSTGEPTAWAWDFGDGQTSTERNPVHVFGLPGSYPVTLRAANEVGDSAPVTRTVTVTPAPTTGPTVSAGPAATAVAAVAAAGVTVPVPAGVQTGDLLVAQVTADNAPTMAEVPAGWTPVLTQLNVTSGARVFVYSRPVPDAAAEPASHAFTLSAAQRWGVVVGSFRGVDLANPFDTAATTRTDTTYRATSLTVPGVTTVAGGAMLVGGVGFDARSVAVTPPAGWAEIGESTNGQVAELAVQARPTAGPTGDATWSFGAAAAGGWLRALRPAGAGPAPMAPTAAFTASAETGTAPLEVRFTDTSTGEPTAWAWDFGDGRTSTDQNPVQTFAAPGTYAVALRAANAVGQSAPATRTITVTAAPTSGPTVTAGPAATAVAAVAAAEVTVPVPAGVQTGDLLVAQVTADNAPTMSAVPPGWTPVLTPLAVTSGARVFVYSYVVADAAAEPASHVFTLSAAQRWGAVVGSFRGVDPANPFDTAATTRTDTTYRATGLTVPGVTTATAGAMLVGGVGFDHRTVAVTPPAGWAELGESTNGQVAELAVQARPTAGATGDATWSFGTAAAAGGWLRALRPAPAP